MPSIDLKDQYFGCEIEMTGLTRQQAAEAVASLFGTTAVHSRSSRTYDPWEVTDNEGKTWRFVYDSSIHGSHRTGRQQIPIGDGCRQNGIDTQTVIEAVRCTQQELPQKVVPHKKQRHPKHKEER